MNMTRDRVQSIVWAVVIAVSAALLLTLTLRVNAVKAQVRLTERRIIATKQDKLSLETEFQTRANQQQLAQINAVEFGFKAPGAGQYVEGERQLAALNRPVAPAIMPGAPATVRMATAQTPATVRMAKAETPAPGSLPAALAPLARQALRDGPGTRFLSDQHEVTAKPATRTPPDPARKPKADKAARARLALGDAPVRASVKADVKAAKQ